MNNELNTQSELSNEDFYTAATNKGIAIKVEGVSKIFRLYEKPIDRLKEALHPFRKKFHHDFYALRDINLEVKKGETTGIIGQNGSGKSTLLKIITGILTPSAGHISVNGRISSLLELGTGFNPELTGIENIYFNGTVNGLLPQEIDSSLDNILSFAEIGEFAQQPIKIYSSGMFVRLAFACAINIQPDILIIDEALSVGDAYFQIKSMNKMKMLMESGCTILFVSHDAGAVRTLCKKAHLLHEGTLVYSGFPLDVFDFYNSIISMKHKNSSFNTSISETQKAEQFKSIGKRTGNFKIEIQSVRMLNTYKQETDSFVTGELVSIYILAKANENILKPTFGIAIRDRLGNDIFGVNNLTIYQESIDCVAGNVYSANYSFPLNIGVGVYSLTVAIHDNLTHIDNCYDWINDVLTFRITNSTEFQFTGFCRIKPDFKIEAV